MTPLEFHHFTADFAGQTLGLSLPARQPLLGQLPGRITLDAAAALHHAEDWLPEVETWLAHGLVPALCPQKPNWDHHWELIYAPPPPAQRNLEERTAAQMHLPWPALVQLKTPLPGWTWQPAHGLLILDNFDLPASELADIDIGALIVLPGSFAPTWHARLGPDPLAYAVQLQKINGQLVLQTQAQIAPAMPTHHSTVCMRHTTLSPRVGGRKGAGNPLHFDIQAPAPITLHASVLQGAQPLAAGQLIPVANGYGLRIERLFGPAPMVHNPRKGS
jgi:hypothetical protein